jgi:hypothetical protein
MFLVNFVFWDQPRVGPGGYDWGPTVASVWSKKATKRSVSFAVGWDACRWKKEYYRASSYAHGCQGHKAHWPAYPT